MKKQIKNLIISSIFIVATLLLVYIFPSSAQIGPISPPIGVNWTSIYSFPVACPANSYVTQLNGSVTCTEVVNIPNGALGNFSDFRYGNTTGSYNETISGRAFTTNYQKVLRVGAGKEFTTIQSAINSVPFMMRHNYTMIIDDGTYAEDLYFPPMICQRKHPTEGSGVSCLEVKGNTSNINGVKVKSIQTTGIIGANGLGLTYMQIYGQDPTSDELTSLAVYGSNKVIAHHINFTNSTANYAVMAYSSNLEVHTSYFNNMAYAGLSKVQSNLRLGDNYQGSGNNGTLTTAIAKSDDASFVFIQQNSDGIQTLFAPIIADGSGITSYGFNDKPNLFLNQGSITMTNSTGATVIRDKNITTTTFELERLQIQSFYTSYNNPLIYSTGQSGSAYPFTENGHLIIQPRTSTQDRDIIFAVGDVTPDIPLILDGANGGGAIFGYNATGSNPPIIIVRNTTAKTCSVANAGAVYYDGSLFKHYGCNSTTWNALY